MKKARSFRSKTAGSHYFGPYIRFHGHMGYVSYILLTQGFESVQTGTNAGGLLCKTPCILLNGDHTFGLINAEKP